MSKLKLNGVNKVFPSGATALYDINLEAEEKEFLVILGGESSGKTTLLRVIAGLEDITSGEVFIGGKNVTESEPKDRDVAMVFKNSTLYPAMTIYDNIGFGLKLRNASSAIIEQRVKAVSGILGLNDVLYRKPKALTSAAKQRVALGRAMAREPKLYLFDESLSGLDDNLRLDMLNLIINVQARMQGTFVYATKNLSEAMNIGTRIVLLKNGLVQQIDTPANLYDYPANAYVAFFIGSPTINFVRDAVVVKEEEGYFAKFGEFKIAIAENIVKRFSNIDEYADTQKNIILGIRPEDTATANNGKYPVTVLKTESAGEQIFAECDFGGGISLVVSAANEAERGTQAFVNIDSSRLYIFDSTTRLTLLERDEGYVNTGHADAQFKPMPFEEENAIIEKLKPAKKENKKKLR